MATSAACVARNSVRDVPPPGENCDPRSWLEKYFEVIRLLPCHSPVMNARHEYLNRVLKSAMAIRGIRRRTKHHPPAFGNCSFHATRSSSRDPISLLRFAGERRVPLEERVLAPARIRIPRRTTYRKPTSGKYSSRN